MKPYVNDLYAPLAHIPELTENKRNTTTPTWVDDYDARRLEAYNVLGAYRNNVRRFHLPKRLWVDQIIDGDVIPSVAANRREYGDPALLIDSARALVLGEQQTLRFTDGEEAPQQFVDWLDEWAVKERITQKLLEGEENTIGDGDGVYTIGWSKTKNRPRLRTYDPGFYFPDTENLGRVKGWDDDEYPATVHLAWEWEDRDQTKWVRRTTWQMVHLDTPEPLPYGGTAEWKCYYRAVDYDMSKLVEGASVYSPEMGTTAVPLTEGASSEWVDLGIDFIPVVHVPNDSASQRTFGRALMLRVAQILDDIGDTDTDIAAAAQEAVPRLLTTGVDAGGIHGPGGQLAMPDGSNATYLDTSKNLIALQGQLKALLERLATNTRLAQALLGQVRPDDVPSGYALELGFHPARQLLREMRTVRDEKYPLILKFAMRIAQAHKILPAQDTPAAVIELGASLPADKSTAVDAVTKLLTARGMSTTTAVRVLIEAGFPIDDAEEEVERIVQEDTEAAVRLVEATGDVSAARARLGMPDVVLPIDVPGLVPDEPADE